ncbi:hypothetical protein P7K49_014872 [Saguinus oedipus]|uniref:Uncharacterized protein n=1 Tax=Saguinus oedipus TaxID=9490 RepID=A0ABQ9V7L8_SAGOE|nr:hypothetical protein P7K49_014872 [Saguinus oedipus]
MLGHKDLQRNYSATCKPAAVTQDGTERHSSRGKEKTPVSRCQHTPNPTSVPQLPPDSPGPIQPACLSPDSPGAAEDWQSSVQSSTEMRRNQPGPLLFEEQCRLTTQCCFSGNKKYKPHIPLTSSHGPTNAPFHQCFAPPWYRSHFPIFSQSVAATTKQDTVVMKPIPKMHGFSATLSLCNCQSRND